jgi:hypothetical protein
MSCGIYTGVGQDGAVCKNAVIKRPRSFQRTDEYNERLSDSQS